MTQRLASCGLLLSNPATFENCRRLLQGHWLRFLDQNFSAEEPVAAAAQPEISRALPTDEEAASTKSKSRRFRGFGNPRR